MVSVIPPLKIHVGLTWWFLWNWKVWAMLLQANLSGNQIIVFMQASFLPQLNFPRYLFSLPSRKLRTSSAIPHVAPVLTLLWGKQGSYSKNKTISVLASQVYTQNLSSKTRPYFWFRYYISTTWVPRVMGAGYCSLQPSQSPPVPLLLHQSCRLS